MNAVAYKHICILKPQQRGNKKLIKKWPTDEEKGTKIETRIFFMYPVLFFSF